VTLIHKLSCRGSLFVTRITADLRFRIRKVWRDIAQQCQADMNPVSTRFGFLIETSADDSPF